LTIWHCILSAELKKGTPSDCFFGDFAHWEVNLIRFLLLETFD